MKKVLLTGASKGIGKALAISLAEAGHTVGAMARSKDALEELAAGDYQGKIIPLPADLSSKAQMKETFDSFLQEAGSIDILINNAGAGIFKTAEELSLEEWDKIMSLNARATFYMCNLAIPEMKKQGAGHIIGVATDVSKRTIANGSLYCASKYAQDAFLGSLRKEVRKDNIKVSVIYPGLVDTYFHGAQTGAGTQVEFLNPGDVADSVIHIVNAPAHVVIDELMIHPISQEY
ncbi:MAG: SDR family oxidoreductase [Saprospiraceae bacterium]|nr:SDR family oxidoreductase [Saprospiraceae bacterium]